MTTHDDTATLNEMIEVLHDGQSFYDEAAQHVHSDLGSVFSRMARTKANIATDLSAKVAARGDTPAEGGSFAGSIRKFYAELRTALASDKAAAYVVQLEEFEDRILAAFRKAVEESNDEGVREIAQRYMPEVTRDHNDMRALKKIQQARA